MRSNFTTAFVLLALCSLLPAQTSADLHKSISAAVAEKNNAAAVKHLGDLRRSDNKLVEANNYDYLLARMLEKNGNNSAAMALFQTVAARGSVLKPYALWHLAQLARSTGNLPLERLYLNELIAASSDSILRPAAENRLARSYFESGDFAAVLSSLSAPGGNFSGTVAERNNLFRENLILTARSYVQTGKPVEARGVFTKVLDQTPNQGQPDDFALTAAEGLDHLDASSASLTDYEHLRRATIYQFNRNFESARRHYQRILEKFPQSGIVPDATFQIGRGYTLQGEFIEAINWYERVIEQFPGHQAAKDVLLQAASVYARVGKYRESISRYKRFIELYPADERLDRAYLNIIDVLRDQGEENDALAWSAKTQETFRQKLPEALALFSDVRLHIGRGSWDAALGAIDKLSAMPDLGGARVPGGTTSQELTFLRGYVLELLARHPEAIDTYLSIPDGRSEYYGWRATERLRALGTGQTTRTFIDNKRSSLQAGTASKDAETVRINLQSSIRLTVDETQRHEQLAQLRNIYRSLPVYNKIPSLTASSIGRTKLVEGSGTAAARTPADELLFLGLCDEGAPAYDAQTKGRPGAINFSLARCFQDGDQAHRSIAFIEPLWRNVPADFQIELIPREQLEMLYPAPYAESLIKFAPPRGVDPRFVLSIMRQESRYRADVKSYAAARGLMQFISSTANTIAGKVGRNNFRQEDLYDPATSILFGSQYLSDLYKLFPEQHAAVAASYNGGEDNVGRWLRRSKSNMADQYVPEVVFTQSKDYVYKVLANYRVYRFLYDENLKIRG